MKNRFGTKALGASLILYLMFTTGCYYDQVYTPAPDIPDGVSYAADMQPYFDSSCTGCHSGNTAPDLSSPGSYGELINGGYVNTADPASSLLYTKIAPGGTMEQYSTPTETAMTLKWIEEGALNN
jgi:hypothetical protein